MGGLGWLVFGVAGDRTGMSLLPDAEGSTVELLADVGRRYTIAEVAALPAKTWTAWGGWNYIRAGHGDAVWMRVTLCNPTSELRRAALADTEYFSDRVEAWVMDGDGTNPEAVARWPHFQSGEAVPARVKPWWSRTAAFPVIVPAGGRQVVYLRAEDYYFPYLRLRWWPRMADFVASQVRDTLAESVCYGALMALMLYNAVLWARMRFPDTGYYVLYAGAMLTFNFVSNGGLALLGFAAGSPWKEMLVVSSMALNGVFLVQFARAYLTTAVLLPRMDRVLRRGIWLLIALVAGVAAMPAMSGLLWLNLAVPVIMATYALVLVAAVSAWRAGAGQARFFVGAFGLLFAGGLPAGITWLNHDIAAGAAMGMLAGATLEMILLSFAVADRFARTQRQLVEETEQRRAIEEAYADELAIEVRERTRELAEANADKDRMLAVIGHDLRSPLTGLMRAADATPGAFAHEMSRTGRTLLLLIEDLVLWARLRAGTRVLAVHPAPAVLAPALVLHRTLAEHGGIELALVAPDDLRVATDLVLAQTLVRNLLANGLKFARRRVELRAETVAGGVRFTVGNDGPPLPPDVAARFAAGEDEPLSATGGLGLRLCREICHALGSRLEAGTAGDGTTEFRFVLPAAPASTA